MVQEVGEGTIIAIEGIIPTRLSTFFFSSFKSVEYLSHLKFPFLFLLWVHIGEKLYSLEFN